MISRTMEEVKAKIDSLWIDANITINRVSGGWDIQIERMYEYVDLKLSEFDPELPVVIENEDLDGDLFIEIEVAYILNDGTKVVLF